MKKHGFIVAAAVAIAIGSIAVNHEATAQTDVQRSQPTLPIIPLTIYGSRGPVYLHLEVASTERQQEVGLMYRVAIPAHGGMLFPMRPARQARFWMRNTFIPLDMLFVRTNSTISRIATAQALDEHIVNSGEPVTAVIELGAGQAKALGIRAGDRVEWYPAYPA
jgi:uncharacterized protein